MPGPRAALRQHDKVLEARGEAMTGWQMCCRIHCVDSSHRKLALKAPIASVPFKFLLSTRIKLGECIALKAPIARLELGEFIALKAPIASFPVLLSTAYSAQILTGTRCYRYQSKVDPLSALCLPSFVIVSFCCVCNASNSCLSQMTSLSR